MRLLGVYCQQSSCGCNKEVADAISDTVSACLGETSKILGYSKNPTALAMSEAFEAAAVIVKAVTKIAEWLANAIEGDDDVYIQHTNKGYDRLN